MKARMDALAGMLQKLGLSKERFRVDYVSSAEGEKFVQIVKEMNEPNEGTGKRKDTGGKRKASSNLREHAETQSSSPSPCS